MASANAPWTRRPRRGVSTVWRGMRSLLRTRVRRAISCPAGRASRQKRRHELGDLLERVGVAGDPAVSCAVRLRTRDATMPSAGPRAATSHGRRRRSRQCRACGPRRRDRRESPAQRLSVRMASQSSSNSSVSGRRTFHNSGSRNVTMVRSPLDRPHRRDRRTSPGMWTMLLVSMPSCASFSKMKRLDVRGRRPSDRRSRRGRRGVRSRSRR